MTFCEIMSCLALGIKVLRILKKMKSRRSESCRRGLNASLVFFNANTRAQLSFSKVVHPLMKEPAKIQKIEYEQTDKLLPCRFQSRTKRQSNGTRRIQQKTVVRSLSPSFMSKSTIVIGP